MKPTPVLPKPGDVVAGKYRIEKIAGEGGMGVVYAAHHLILDRRVALKVLLVDAARGDEVIERFVREAQAAARLHSDHVVRVMDAGSLENDLPFFVMEHLEGYDLAELLKLDGPLDPTELADYGLQVLAALAEAHGAGIVHRDLKPANLFFAVGDNGRSLIKVLDFGISKQDSERTQWKQLTGQAILGTPSYMSPEQLRSSKNVDARADIWSLGVSLYQLASGQLPFDGDGPGEIFAAILEQTPTPLRAHRPEVPQAFEEIVSRCLQRDPASRFSDVGEMATALAALGSGQWAHLLAAIEHSLTRSKRAPETNVALVEAAVAAAITSRPAPPMATGISLVVDVAFTPTEFHVSPLNLARDETTRQHPKAVKRRRPRLLWAAAFVVPLALVVSFLLPRATRPAPSLGGPWGDVLPLESSRPMPLTLALPAPVLMDALYDVTATAEEATSVPAFSAKTRPAPVSKSTVSAVTSMSKERPKFLKSRD